MSLYLPTANVIAKTIEKTLWILSGQHEQTEPRRLPHIEETPAKRNPPLHALIIGIDKFKCDKIRDLHGCLADANAFADYLREDLGVPDSQIVNLRNEQATRAAIIRELKGLKTNPSIHKGDPILIFFAAHGTSAKAPSGWTASGEKISLIVPYDCLTPGPDGKSVQPIPDRTLAALLDELAHPESGKGDNITVIFDCCHSGSGTRIHERASTRLQRGFTLETPVPADLDEGIWQHVSSDRAVAVAAGYAHRGSKSHVLLAACSSEEIAQEESGRGVFTRALLEVLQSTDADKLTYDDLLRRVQDLPGQTPQCEGEHAGRVLFNARVAGKGSVIYRVTEKERGYTMEAGSAHGITKNTKFAIYRSRDFSSKDQPLATMTARAVAAFSTDMQLDPPSDSPFRIKDFYFASQTSVGEEEALKLHVPLNDQHLPVFQALATELKDSERRTILFVDEHKADMSIVALPDGRIEYRHKDALLTGYGLSRLYYASRPDPLEIYPVIHSASQFFWHLKRSPEKNLLRNKVKVAFHRVELTDEVDDDLMEILRPAGENLNRDGVIEVEADNRTRYGVTVHNLVTVPLHVSLFYFDCSTLKISSYYLPPSTGAKAEAPLPGNGTLPIGYGDGGGSPYKYYLRPEQDFDLGFLKLFISTEPVDLGGIKQPSAFAPDRDGIKVKRRPKPIWDAITIAVVQRKPGSKDSTHEPELTLQPQQTPGTRAALAAAIETQGNEKHPMETPAPQREERPTLEKASVSADSVQVINDATPVTNGRDDHIEANSTIVGSVIARPASKIAGVPFAVLEEPHGVEKPRWSFKRFLSKLCN